MKGNLMQESMNPDEINTASPDNEAPDTRSASEVELTDEQKGYLKGIGLQGIDSQEAILKVLDTAIKQKASVSRSSKEIEQLKIKLASRGEDITEPQEPTLEEESSAQKETQTSGITDNDLFDLSQMIAQFPELTEGSQDGSVFAELRQLGYFGVNGINKQAIYSHLTAKNNQLKELRELREFKAKYDKAEQEIEINQKPGLNLNIQMNRDLATQIVYAGDQNNPRYEEAVKFLQNGLLK